MNMPEKKLIGSAYSAVLPWDSIDALQPFSIATDSQELIDKCCNCPYADCYNCLSGRARKEPKYYRFIDLFEKHMSREDICSELKISRKSYFNYRNKLLGGIVA